MLEDRHILRLGENLISGDAAAVRLALQVADDAVSQPFSLVVTGNRNISHHAAAQRAGADELAIIEKPHGVIDDAGESQIKAFQKFDHLRLLFRVGQKYFAFRNHFRVLL